MSIELLERGAAALGALRQEVVFVGGATITLWITNPGAPPPRPTKDVDVIVEVTTRLGLHEFEARLRDAGFQEDRDSGVICRWNHRDDPSLILDAMPARADLMGFVNRWQSASLPYAEQRTLPSGIAIKAVPPPFLLGTKLEAHRGRGGHDLLTSHDLEDVIALIDGREELVAEVQAAPPELRSYVSTELEVLLMNQDFTYAISGLVRPDEASQARIERWILPRMRTMVETGPISGT